MIGVLAKESDSWAVREFFQLFKTPWKFCKAGEHYDLAIVTLDEIPRNFSADAIVLYNSRVLEFDDEFGLTPTSRTENNFIEWQDNVIPVYGNLVAFGCVGDPLIKLRHTIEVVGGVLRNAAKPSVRIGLDLFREVALLLTEGQPVENARYPTLDIHISLLRAIMVTLGVPFIEVPPVPAGYDFMACLTHDVDFVGVRDHKLDHTMWGFLYRSTLGSFLKSISGRLTWSKCFQNWKAAVSLPLVYLGFLPDFWLEFERYMEIENDFGSTFFFIPFKDFSGNLDGVPAPRRRAAKYDLIQIKDQVLELAKNGCEIGLHGIDAWRDCDSAQSERTRVCEVTGQTEIGTRMHWLYWNQSSAVNLERAKFTYDSSFGYNNAIGFRAGTTQVFRFLDCEQLLEIPLNIQDSAMFYSDRMMLSDAEALNACLELIHSLMSFGGVLTVNWHTRSLSPERLWGNFYTVLLNEIRARRVWFGTAKEIVQWFRRRRELRFESVEFQENGARVELSGLNWDSGSFNFSVRLHDPKPTAGDMRLHAWDALYRPEDQGNTFRSRAVLQIAY